MLLEFCTLKYWKLLVYATSLSQTSPTYYYSDCRFVFTPPRRQHRRQRRRGCRGHDPPPIFDLQGSSCVDDPQYFDKTVFYFFPFSGTSIKFIIQLQSIGHTNVKKNTPRMQHITPFSDEKFVKFSGKGHSRPPDPIPSPPTAPRFSRLGRSACDPPPMFQWR